MYQFRLATSIPFFYFIVNRVKLWLFLLFPFASVEKSSTIMPMRKQAAHFLNSIAYERGLSEHTRAAYERDLSFFFLFLEEQKVSTFEEVTRGHIASFLLREKRQGAAIATRARRLVAIKVFFSYLVSEGHLRQNVTASVESRRQARPAHAW